MLRLNVASICIFGMFLLSACGVDPEAKDACRDKSDCTGDKRCVDGTCKFSSVGGPDTEGSPDATSVQDISEGEEIENDEVSVSLEPRLVVDAEASVSSEVTNSTWKPSVSLDCVPKVERDRDTNYDLDYDWTVQKRFDDSAEPKSLQGKSVAFEPDFGSYEAKCTASGTFDGRDVEKSDSVSFEVESPEFSVSANVSGEKVQVGEKVNFNCQQEPTVPGSSYRWFSVAFDDVNEKGFERSFEDPGTYTATCEVTPPDTSVAETKSVQFTVEEDPEPRISFVTATPESGRVPLEVSFSTSVRYGGPKDELTYKWEFGDGATSTEKEPTHTYTTVPTVESFEVRLTVTDANGDTSTETTLVHPFE